MSAPVSLIDAASTSNQRVVAFHDLRSPSELLQRWPLTVAQSRKVERDRQEIADIFAGDDDRLVVVVGPCSIHDPKAALDYAAQLAPLAEKFSADLKVVMRVYFEKPRTTVGWKGLINDPHLDGSYDIAYGLELARNIMVDVLNVGLPVGCEFLEPNSPQYYADAVAWGAIGARTTESQVHRQLASGLSMPIGFKNGTDGSVQVAIDAVQAASHPHFFFGTSDYGRPAVVETAGNENCHIILRGGSGGPNYSPADIQHAMDRIGDEKPRIMIDASHANSNKDDARQIEVIRELAQTIGTANSPISTALAGVMIESFLEAGAQKLDPEKLKRNGGDGLVYGQSVTDKCINFEDTAVLLEELAGAVAQRRGAQGFVASS